MGDLVIVPFFVSDTVNYFAARESGSQSDVQRTELATLGAYDDSAWRPFAQQLPQAARNAKASVSRCTGHAVMLEIRRPAVIAQVNCGVVWPVAQSTSMTYTANWVAQAKSARLLL